MAKNLPMTWLYFGKRQYRYRWLSDSIRELMTDHETWNYYKLACNEITWVLKRHLVKYPEKQMSDSWKAYGQILMARLQELHNHRRL